MPQQLINLITTDLPMSTGLMPIDEDVVAPQPWWATPPSCPQHVHTTVHRSARRRMKSPRGSLGGAAVWRLPLAQGVILETRDRIPHQAPGAWSLLLPLPVSLRLSFSLCDYHKTKQKKKIQLTCHLLPACSSLPFSQQLYKPVYCTFRYKAITSLILLLLRTWKRYISLTIHSI